MLGHGGTRTEAGSPLKKFYASWEAAVERAREKCPEIPADLLRHDLRRSAVRLMIQDLGRSEEEAMRISGHKTRDMLIRYNIRTVKSLKKNAEEMDSKFQELRAKVNQLSS